MATKLSQIIAVEKGVKGKAHGTLTETYHKIQKAPLLSGLSRKYEPKDEEGEQLPPESTRVQLTVERAIEDVHDDLARLFDVTATKDWGNCVAKATVRVNGETILEDVPITYLLFLEKQLTDLHTFVKKLPVLDPAEEWIYDPNSAVHRTEPVKTIKTKKVPRNHVKAEATDKHPAQVEVYYEDVPVGYWHTTKFSGAAAQARINKMLERVEALQAAVKFAREEANGTPVVDQHVGEVVLGYIFG